MYWHCIAIRCAAIARRNDIVKLIDGPNYSNAEGFMAPIRGWPTTEQGMSP